MADVKSRAADEHGLPTNPLRPADRAIREWCPTGWVSVTGQPGCAPEPPSPSEGSTALCTSGPDQGRHPSTFR